MAQWIQSLAGSSEGTVLLHLFGDPCVTVAGCRVAVPDGSKRLLAFVALHHDRVERRHAAGALWPIGDDMHAAASLRSTLWRLNRACVPLIAADRRSLRLRAEVVTDLAIAGRWAKRIIDG